MRKIIIIHIAACFFFTLISMRKRDMRLVYRIAMVFFLPGTGILLFLILAISDIFTKKVNAGLLLEPDGDIQLAGLGQVRKIDYRKEIDIVPIEDALLVNSNDVVRKMVFDIFKEDAITYMAYLEKALESSDTEATHYAAAAVLDVQKKLMNALQEFSYKYESNKEDTDLLIPFIDVLKSYLSSNLLDEKSRRKYRNIYSQVLGDLIKVKPDKEYFISKIDCDIELSEYAKVEEYCGKFMNMYPDAEEPYLTFMKYYFIMKDFDRFKATMLSLKNSSIKFSNKALTTIRYWLYGK